MLNAWLIENNKLECANSFNKPLNFLHYNGIEWCGEFCIVAGAQSGWVREKSRAKFSERGEETVGKVKNCE